MSRPTWWLIGILFTASIATTLFIWPKQDPSLSIASQAARDQQSEFEIDEATERKIVAFCSACHAMPVPGSFTRNAWHHEVMQGYHFYAKSGRSDLDPPTPAQAISYFRARASDELKFPETPESSSSLKISFRNQDFPVDPTIPVPSGIAFLKRIPAPVDEKPELLSCDMRLGTIHRIGAGEKLRRIEVGRFGNPCHAEVCDINGDGQQDIVVADLGSFDPDDHERGRVLSAPLSSERQRQPIELATGFGRICDVRPADFDADGDLDLVVAEFGWHRTGGIHVLWNSGQSEGKPEFRKETVYRRPGAIHVPVADMNGDQRPDVVALVSQEHERVELLLNGGSEPWETQTIWSAHDPAFGMSGLELVDLDRDGDVDILFTNGDTFDSISIKPSHGIQWLRNDGSLTFEYQRIADLPGAYRAVPVDLDGDDDLDIVASVWLPRQSNNAFEPKSLAALLVYEQTEPMKFARHTLLRGNPCFASIEVGDFNKDGRPDIAAGWFLSSTQQSSNWISIWWNEPAGGASP